MWGLPAAPKPSADEARGLAALPLLDFVPALTPTLLRPYWLSPVANLFERIDQGEQVFACVSVPPQHGKTDLIALHGIPWLLKRHPDWPILYGSYAAALAQSKSRDALANAKRVGIDLREDKQSAYEWRTPEGGGLIAAGVDGGFTGHPGRVAIIDDPHKNRQEAESAASRAQVKSFVQGSIIPRRHPSGSLLFVHTRWHPDDCIGWVMRELSSATGIRFEHLNLDAIRPDGTALAPELRPLSFLETQRELLGGPDGYEWLSLYRGQPRPRGTALFPSFATYEKLPATGLLYGLGYDFAYSGKTSSNWSVVVVLARELIGRDKHELPIFRYYVVDVLRRQRVIEHFAAEATALASRYPSAKGLWYTSSTEVGVAGLLGLLGVRVEARRASEKGDKFIRAQPVAAAVRAGRVLVPANAPEWLKPFLDVVTAFTGVNDPADDDVDALAAAFDVLDEQPVDLADVVMTGTQRLTARATLDAVFGRTR
jgi:predicted phage terminase large subunit-like protein